MMRRPNNRGDNGGNNLGILVGIVAAVIYAPMLYNATVDLFVAAIEDNYPPALVELLKMGWRVLMFPAVFIPAQTATKLIYTMIVVGGVARVMSGNLFGFQY